MYQERFYRNWMGGDDLEGFRIVIGESDLSIQSDRRDARKPALEALGKVRREIEDYIACDYSFKESLCPIHVARHAGKTVKAMAKAGRTWNVGPMAAVAGAVAEFVGKSIGGDAKTVIVENGGDIWAKSQRTLRFGLYAGEDSPFKDKLAFEVDAKDGVGVCTSSAKVGPSLSFGNADAVVAIADDAAFADAAATAIANGIKTPADVGRAVEKQKEKRALKGVIACMGDRLGIWGKIKIFNR